MRDRGKSMVVRGAYYGGEGARRRRLPARPRWEVVTVSYMPAFDASLPSAVLDVFLNAQVRVQCCPPLSPHQAPLARVPLAEIPTRELTARGRTAQALETVSRPLAGIALPVFMWPCLTVAPSPPPRLMLLLRSAGPAGYVATAPSEASRGNPSGEFFSRAQPLPNRR